MNAMGKSITTVCVTGGSGYIGSLLVRKLLTKGYTVHATLRNLEEKQKVGLLKSLPNAEANLVLFQADLYNPTEFEPAIDGCEFVFHVANPSTQKENRVEATVSGVRSIADSCIRSKTVKRLIYTASVTAASTLNESGAGVTYSIDEDCWTPLDLSLTYGTRDTTEYVLGKTLAEKEVLSYNESDAANLEVVTLACGLVGGETIVSHVPLSVEVICSQITGNSFCYYNGLEFIQELLGSVPLVHIDDVCEAHIFCMETPSIRGRFLCAAVTFTVRDIANYIEENHPQFKIEDKFRGEAILGSTCDSSKLRKLGFDYKNDMKKIVDESLECVRRLGTPQQVNLL